jgi:hypothetical protein
MLNGQDSGFVIAPTEEAVDVQLATKEGPAVKTSLMLIPCVYRS